MPSDTAHDPGAEAPRRVRGDGATDDRVDDDAAAAPAPRKDQQWAR